MSVALPESISVGIAAAETYPTTHFSGTEGAYMLPHHAKEIERLQRQHRFMNSTTEGKLLVTPNTEGFSPLRILDAGCADGACNFAIRISSGEADSSWMNCRHLAKRYSPSVSR
jgi:hypothetical protein